MAKNKQPTVFLEFDPKKGVIFTTTPSNGILGYKADSIEIKKKRIIDKNGDSDFTHNSALIHGLGEGADYYAVFDVLWTLLSNGGFASYEDIGNELKRRLRKTKGLSPAEMRKFIVDKLDEHNGFLHYAKIPVRVRGGKKLIETVRGKGIQFNNLKGG